MLRLVFQGGLWSTKWTNKKKSRTCHVVYCQKQLAVDYVDHLYQIWKPFLGTPPRINKIGGIKPGKALRYEARFKTYSHDSFNDYYDLFYPPSIDGKRVKRVPKNMNY